MASRALPHPNQPASVEDNYVQGVQGVRELRILGKAGRSCRSSSPTTVHEVLSCGRGKRPTTTAFAMMWPSNYPGQRLGTRSDDRTSPLRTSKRLRQQFLRQHRAAHRCQHCRLFHRLVRVSRHPQRFLVIATIGRSDVDFIRFERSGRHRHFFDARNM